MPPEATQKTTVTVQGLEVPKLGYGTWLVEGQAAYDGVLDALALGYRHIDTAHAYGNERDIGRALSDTEVPREEIWLTTKVWRDDAAEDDLKRVFAQQLRDLDVDYVDLLLLHWPAE
jgi:2,5-diketo-D-gluconate reductase B